MVNLSAGRLASISKIIFRGIILKIMHTWDINKLTLYPLLLHDHEISHQWSGNPYSWDSINQHQRKPQRLLVKLLANSLNTKRLTVSTVGIQLLILVNSLNGIGVHTYIHSLI